MLKVNDKLLFEMHLRIFKGIERACRKHEWENKRKNILLNTNVCVLRLSLTHTSNDIVDMCWMYITFSLLMTTVLQPSVSMKLISSFVLQLHKIHPREEADVWTEKRKVDELGNKYRDWEKECMKTLIGHKSFDCILSWMKDDRVCTHDELEEKIKICQFILLCVSFY